MIELSAYIDLLVLGLSVAAIAVLGCIILFSDSKNSTNVAFFAFSLAGTIWAVINFAAYQTTSQTMSLMLWRYVIFSAVWFCFAIFQLAYIFPKKEWSVRDPYYIVTLAGTGIVSILTLTPLVFERLAALPVRGQVPEIVNGPLIPLFGITVASLVIASIALFVRKGYVTDTSLKRPVTCIMVGTGITFALLITFNFVLPTAMKVYSFIPYGGVFILPFVLCTAYAISRYRVFNIRLVMAELFSFLLVLATLIQIAFSHSFLELAFRTASFILVLGLAILFVRSVVHELKQRETIEAQERELEAINAQQESLLHFISHEIKGYLTKGQNAFAGIVEGDYGTVPDSVRTVSDGALHEMRKGVSTVMDILDASNFKKGTIAYAKQPFDLKAAVQALGGDMRSVAEKKGLAFELQIDLAGDFTVSGDEEKLRHHVIRNLIDNSIRYTLSGKITVSLRRSGNNAVFAVSDTGVGIAPEDMQRLFTQGGKGKDSIKVNVDSTGFGLYVAKQVTVAHGGTIRAFSDGPGTGATFTVELPIVQNTA